MARESCRVVCLIQARLYEMIVRSVCTVSSVKLFIISVIFGKFVQSLNS